MRGAGASQEVEIKLEIPGPNEGRALLKQAGFRLLHRRVFESNVMFDSAHGRLRRARQLLRVRRVGSRAILTYKGPPEPGRHKSREEIEMPLTDASAFELVLDRLGMAPSFVYEKYRTEFRPETGRGGAMLDETPVGTFIELEGSPGWIDRTARKLGFSESDYITASYATLYFARTKGKRPSPPAMVFGERQD